MPLNFPGAVIYPPTAVPSIFLAPVRQSIGPLHQQHLKNFDKAISCNMTMSFQHEWLCLLQEKTSLEQAPRIVIAQGQVPGKAQPPSLGHGCARNAVILSRRQEVPEVVAALSVININTYG